MTRSPVTADDLDHAVRLALATLRRAPADGWRAKAGSLDWDCWSTVEHLADTLFAYACQLASSRPPEDGYVPCATTAGTPGGPECAVHADLKAGPAGLLMTLEACAGIEAAVMRTAPPDARAWHPYGLADAEAFTAMGVVETCCTRTTPPWVLACRGHRPPACARGCATGCSRTRRPTQSRGPPCCGPAVAATCRAGSG
jgi:hypothetical protein